MTTKLTIKTRQEYDALPALNYSGAKELLKSPAHYKAYLAREREETKALRVGSAVHCAVLQGNEAFNAAFAVSPKFDRRTKEGKAAYEAFEATAAGKTVLSEDEWTIVDEVHRAALACTFNHKFKFTATEFMIATEYCGTPIKSALDAIDADGYIYDLKTTEDASEAGFLKSVRAFKYNLQAVFYTMAYSCFYGRKPAGFRFIVVEKEPPYATAVYELGPELMTWGLFDFEAAVKAYKTASALDEWPGYPDDIRVIDINAKSTTANAISFA